MVRREGQSAATVEGRSGWASADEQLFGVRAFRLSVHFVVRTGWNPMVDYYYF